MCNYNWAVTSFLPTDVDYKRYYEPKLQLSNFDSFVGISLNGIWLHTGLSELGYDPFFPTAYGTKTSPKAIETDVCLGTSLYSTAYSYYMFSPCIYDAPPRSVA